MTPEEIINQLQRVPPKCEFAPYETALLAAVEQREAITPELIAAIERVTADPAAYLQRHEDCLHIFAFYLLAQFRETRALNAFLRFCSLPGEQALDLTGDLIAERGAVVLASVCGGDPAPLLRLGGDEAINEYVRGQAISGLLVQCVWSERPREAVIDDLRGLFATLAKPGNASVWAALVEAVRDFNAPELLPEARRAFAGELVDEGIIGLEDIDPEAARSIGYPESNLEENYQWFRKNQPPVDAVTECSTWLCFSDEADEPGGWDDGWRDDLDKDWLKDEFRPESLASGLAEAPPFYESASTPYIAPPKVGRNDPCPCGSGKKYKKCCG